MVLLFFIFSGLLGLYGSTLLFGSRDALNPGLGGVRDVASALTSHKQTQSNRLCCFQTLDAVFPKDLLSDCSETTTAVDVPCGGPKKVSPYIDIVLSFLYFLVLSDYMVQHFYLGAELRSTRA